MTKLLFVDNGIEFDSTLVREKPFGGAEVAFVSLVEELAKLNFEVKIFNNCVNQGLINSVNWKKLDASIEEEKFDVLIVNRGDKFLNFRKECQRRVFWIHNPASYLLKFRYLSKLFMNNFKNSCKPRSEILSAFKFLNFLYIIFILDFAKEFCL